VVAYLNTHPSASASALETEAPLIDGEKAFGVTPLAPGLLAVSATYGELGNIFLGLKPNKYVAA